MNQVRLITAEDFADDCPVSLGLAMQLTRSEPDALPDLLGDITEATRADLAVWLYGRSHTRETGLRVAATCDGASLRRAAGLLGNQLYDLSRQPYTMPSPGVHGGNRRQVSLGGSRGSVRAFA